MAQSGVGGGWHLKLASLLALGGLALCGNSASAQMSITPDGTLGAESSVVTPINPQVDQIDGGAIRGTNLFHSFSEFNINEGRGAYFANPAGIQTIFSRVTGGNPSRLLGTLGVLGDANLFFLNPNGILFGSNASLDLRGSFVASTASSLLFSNGSRFSARNPEAPPLLTIDVPVPIGLQYEGVSGAIGVQGSTLEVQPDKTLALVGGDISLDGGILRSPGGRVELGGVAGAGLVGLDVSGNNLRLSFPTGLARADVSLTNGGGVDVVAGGGGSIAINMQNLNVSGGSFLVAGIGQDLGSVGSQAGNITLNATEAIAITSGSQVQNYVDSGAVGNGGDINIKGESLYLNNSAQVATLALQGGNGNAGNLIVHTTDLVRVADYSNLATQTEGVGDAGNLQLTTGRLIVQNGKISTGTSGQGRGGNLSVNASSVQLIGTSPDGSLGGLSTQTEGTGAAGNLTIETGQLIIQDGARVQASSFSAGQGGNLTVIAPEFVKVIGTSANGQTSSGLFSQAQGTGAAGNLTIITGQLIAKGGGQVSTATFNTKPGGSLTVTASDSIELIGTSADSQFSSGLFTDTFGAGNAGNLIVETGLLTIQNGAQVQAITTSSGSGGTVTVTARDSVRLMGTSDDGQSPSGLFTAASLNPITGAIPTGAAGNLEITTRQLIIQDGAIVAASTRGQGNGGEIRVNASDSVDISGISKSGLSSSLFTRTSGSGQAGNITVDTPAFRISDGALLDAQTQVNGNGGKITVNANTFEAIDGGKVLTTTSGSGKAGDITLNIKDSIALSESGSGLFANTDVKSTGVGGGIFLNSNQLTIRDKARVSVESRGSGVAGNIEVTGDSILLKNQGKISAETFSSSGGNIRLRDVDSLQVRNGEISASTRTGQAGSLSINAGEKRDSSIELRGEGGLLVEATEGGTAGSLTVNTRQMTISDGARVTVSSPKGQAGNIDITADSLSLNRGRITAETGKGQGQGGANIALQLSQNLTLGNESLISAQAFDTANGGNVTIGSRFLIALPPKGLDGSDIIAKAFQGDGGRISINAVRIFGIEQRRAIPGNRTNDFDASSEFGAPGVVELNTQLDPSRGLTNLPDEPRSPDVARGCQAGGGQDTVQYFEIGRGGSLPRPDEPLSSDMLSAEWIPLDSGTGNGGSNAATRMNSSGEEHNRQERALAPNGEAVRTAPPRLVPPCQNR